MTLYLLEHDHESLSELLHHLNSRLQQQDVARSFELLDLFWARLAVHIRAENLCLFPAILTAPLERFGVRDGLPECEEVRAAIESLRSDHNFFMDELAKCIRMFREVPDKNQGQEDLTMEFETIRRRVDDVSLRLETHNVLEEDRVYRWPGLILDVSELEELTVALKRELENMPDRFVIE